MLYLTLSLVLSLAGLLSAGHALLHKRDPRAALGWIVMCLALPGVGMGLYWLLGVNRIRTRARDLQSQGSTWFEPSLCAWSRESAEQYPFRAENFATLLHLSDAVTRRPLLQGNHIEPLHNGEQAYPAMLEAIAGARQSILLSTYIFESNPTGRRFTDALAEAAARGVEVKVLIDGLGERYSFPPARRLLQGSRVRVARFLPPSLSGHGIHLNLRNHRKLLVVDGVLGFSGGMNIGDRHLAESSDPRRVVDIHFRVQGPVVGQMREAFLEDWQLATGEGFHQEKPPAVAAGGQAFCRGISAGPNEDFEKLPWILTGALNCARRRLRIMTPYFVPDRFLIAAINAAALRGVTVEIVLPARNNLPYVAWATRSYLWELLLYNVRIFYQPPPFVHSKLLLVDDDYALVGTANLDPRSLRLNFEFCLEVYDRNCNRQLAAHFDTVRAASRQVLLADVDGRPLPVKLRDAFAKLFSPYL
ncbi:cardiolipin synthase [Desulfuromonas versatilis]|uniref:Cardiolipin synthase n=1 Tax=Desulfuromonas versatilis TaxID=2802975 RepID=A0ABN6DS07_9BACT|nr:cardiolipin synthase [Desulfuromonas versatilis]BCR03005.1 cardiolipin synthase [Desulfuromonas versatilis]